MKYVYLLTENSLVKVSVHRKIFRLLEIRVYPYNRRELGIVEPPIAANNNNTAAMS